MVKHLNVVVRDSELQEFIDRIDGSEWNIIDIEARKQFNFIIQKVLEWNIILEFEYDDEEEFDEEMAEMYDELEEEYQ
jgi:hypothetical protein